MRIMSKKKEKSPKFLSDKEFDRLGIDEALALVKENRLTVSQMERLLKLAATAGSYGSQGQVPGVPAGAQVVEPTDEEKAELRKMGIDPSTVQVMRLPKDYQRGDDDQIQTVNGPVRWADVPKGADGKPTPEWIDANCTCEEHTKKRAAALSKGGPNDGADKYGDGMTGGYI